MVRRTFRLGLWAGLLVGVAAVLMKTMHVRRDSRELAAQAGWGGSQTTTATSTETPAPAAPTKKAVPAARRTAKTTEQPSTEAGWGGTQAGRDQRLREEPSKLAKADATWVSSVDGICPASHPVKGKLTSRLFHLPGMFAYDRTRADRCYASEAAAVADGLTKAKR